MSDDFVVSPAGQDADNNPVLPVDSQKSVSPSGFSVAAEGEVQVAEKPEAMSWVRGTRVRIEKRTKAVDPYTRESFDISAHTKGTIIPSRDSHSMPKDHVLMRIDAPIDNGVGRMIMVEAIDLVKSDVQSPYL